VSSSTASGSGLQSLVGVVLVAVVGYIHFFFDPLCLGTAKSASFSWEEFRQIRPDQSIQEVIDKLGNPIREPEPLRIINPSNGEDRDPCYPDLCHTYRFAGRSDFAWLVAGYREAIVTVGLDGRVVGTVERQE
jgi:hypothetical protein